MHTLLNPSRVQAVRDWMQHATRGLLVLTAAQRGCGVTALLDALVKELSIDPLWLHQPIRAARGFLDDGTKNARTALGMKKILIIDPFDSVCTESTCATDVTEFLKRGLSRVPVIIAGHHLRVHRAKVQDILKKLDAAHVQCIHFPALDDAAVVAALGGGDAAKTAWETSGKDLRNCIQALHFSASGTCVKAARYDGFDAITRMITEDAVTLREAAGLVEGDENMIAGGLFENYPLWSSMGASRRISENMSVADVFESAMYGRCLWGLTGPRGVCIAGVAVETPTTTPAAPLPIMDKYGTVWSRENNKRTKEKIVHAVRMAFPHISVEDIAGIRAVLAAAVERDDRETMRAFAETYGDHTVLAIMRLWKTKYTIAQHKRLTKKE